MARSADNPSQHFARGLAVQSGADAGSLVTLRAPVTLVGSAASCDVRLADDGVHPLHCLLTPADTFVSLRVVGDCTVRVNGRAATSADLQNGDTLEVGHVRFAVQWRSDASSHESHFDSLRIQAAAVAAQQTALNELEIVLTDRETALAGQEADLASRLEHQRRQLLDLQSQIAQARADLRERRHAFAAVVAEQEGQLEATRREATKSQAHIARREQRLARLWAKLKTRIDQQRAEARRQQQQLLSDAKRTAKHLAAKLGALKHQRLQFHTQSELEKRQLAEGWSTLQQAETVLNNRMTGLARKEKELVAFETQLTTSTRDLQARRDALRREIETLEARAINARHALARLQSIENPSVPPAIAPAPRPNETEIELREVADEIADGQTLLANQVGRFAVVRMGWEEERSQLLAELERVAAELANKESRIAHDESSLAATMQKRAAEQAQWEAQSINRRADLERLASVLGAKSRELQSRRESLTELYQRWGRRRAEALAGLRAALVANVAAREEWAASHDRWLRAQARLIHDQQELAARQLAVEQYRRDIIDTADHPEVAAKRLERLQRQWHQRCKAGAGDLKRLAAQLQAESDRLDRRFADLQHEETRVQNRSADLDDLFAVAEIQQLNTAAERAQRHEKTIAEAKQRAIYEQQLTALRDQLERLAALFIETPSPSTIRAA